MKWRNEQSTRAWLYGGTLRLREQLSLDSGLTQFSKGPLESRRARFHLSYLESLLVHAVSCSLLVVAVYKPYDVSTQLFYPWLFFYGFVGIPALVTASILLAVYLGAKRCLSKLPNT